MLTDREIIDAYKVGASINPLHLAGLRRVESLVVAALNTERLWAEYGEPGEPWPYPGVYIVKTPVSEDDYRVAMELLAQTKETA